MTNISINIATVEEKEKENKNSFMKNYGIPMLIIDNIFLWLFIILSINKKYFFVFHYFPVEK